MLLYLDIDGVMVPATIWKRPKILEDGFPEFSYKAVSALNKIISSLGADIVLTTSHKHGYSLSEWNKIFTRRNIHVNKIMRLPENTNYLNRKDELIHWFSSRSIQDEFIIIDDDKSLNGLPENLKNYLIQTSASVGLTEDLPDEAIRIIKKNN